MAATNAAPDESQETRDWTEITNVKLLPPCKDDVLGYPHPQLGNALIPYVTLEYDVHGTGLDDGTKANTKLVLAGDRVKVGADDQIYFILWAEQLPNGTIVLMGLKEKNSTKKTCRAEKHVYQIKVKDMTALAECLNVEKQYVIEYLEDHKRFSAVEDAASTLENFRNLMEKNSDGVPKNLAGARELRITFNKNLLAATLMGAEAFTSNSRESEKKKGEMLMVRQLNEAYLINELTIESDVAKRFLEADGGMAADRAALMLPKLIMDMIMPGSTSDGGAMANEFETSRAAKRRKAPAKATPVAKATDPKAAGSTASAGGKARAKSKSTKANATGFHVATPPPNWPNNFMREIEKTKRHAVGKRTDDPKAGHYCYWANRDKGCAPAGRSVGAKEGADFGAKGETTKIDATDIKRRLDTTNETMTTEINDLTEMVESKDALIVKLRAEKAKLKINNKRRAEHGLVYESNAKNLVHTTTMVYEMVCKLQKVSPAKVGSLEDFEESFKDYCRKQDERGSSSKNALNMDEANSETEEED